MVVRFVSLVSLICAIAIASVNIQNTSDPLFFIVSGGALADTMRIILASLMVIGAYIKLPKTLHPEILRLVKLHYSAVQQAIQMLLLEQMRYAVTRLTII